MAEEPNPELHHIFEEYCLAQEFYDSMIADISLSEEVRAEIRRPR